MPGWRRTRWGCHLGVAKTSGCMTKGEMRTGTRLTLLAAGVGQHPCAGFCALRGERRVCGVMARAQLCLARLAQRASWGNISVAALCLCCLRPHVESPCASPLRLLRIRRRMAHPPASALQMCWCICAASALLLRPLYQVSDSPRGATCSSLTCAGVTEAPTDQAEDRRDASSGCRGAVTAGLSALASHHISSKEGG